MSAVGYLQHLEAVHQNAPIDLNVDILFRDERVGELDFLPLYRECIAATRTPVSGWKTFRRAQRALNLARYFDHSLGIDGARAECGLFAGFSSLLLARVAKMREPDFDGAGLHLVDSFEGLSEPTAKDAIGATPNSGAGQQLVFGKKKGHFACPLEHVQGVLADFPAIAFHKGWIPEVLNTLPETKWAFVHIDVDLFEPTKDCLEYFFPRLAPGGMLINDDYGSPMFPGGGKAWHEYFNARELSYVALDTGQSVYIRTD